MNFLSMNFFWEKTFNWLSIKYPTEIVKIPRVNFRKRKVEKAKKTREQLDEEKKEEEKDPVILAYYATLLAVSSGHKSD